MELRTSAAFVIIFMIMASMHAEPVSSLRPTGFVNDYTGVLGGTDRMALEQKLSKFEKNSSNEIAIVIVKNLDGDYIENYAVKTFESFKIGKKGKDNGILVLVAIKERKVRIEVGYGLEGVVTDSRANRIIEEKIAPRFRQGKYYEGLDDATDSLIGLIGSRGEETARLNQGEYDDSQAILIAFVFFLVFYLFIMLKAKGFLDRGGTLTLGTGKIRTWGRGSSSGGFGGFGGGRSGGGGASGKW